MTNPCALRTARAGAKRTGEKKKCPGETGLLAKRGETFKAGQLSGSPERRLLG
jgi:hypothetical protein